MTRVHLALIAAMTLPTPQSEASAATADLLRQPAEARPFLLYLTSANLSSKERTESRPLLDFWLNSLAVRRSFAFAAPVSATLERIDTRDFGWSTEAVARLMSREPYFASPWLDAVDYHALSPLFGGRYLARLDWFLVETSKEPAYGDLLRLGKTLADLEKRFGVDRATIARLSATHGGRIFQSGVARSGRQIAWLNSVAGSFYQTDEANGNAGKGNILADLERIEDVAAHEIIGRLPNGLHHYSVFDGQGKRLDKAAASVARDTRQKVGAAKYSSPVAERLSEDVEILTAFSCIGCHAQGYRSYTDVIASRQSIEIRAYDKATANRLQDFYDRTAHVQQMEADNAAYAAAVRRCCNLEPLEVSRRLQLMIYRYSDAFVTLETAAAELGVDVASLKERLKASDAERKRIAYLPQVAYDAALVKVVSPPGSNTLKLLVDGLPIPRDAWTEAYPEAATLVRWSEKR